MSDCIKLSRITACFLTCAVFVASAGGDITKESSWVDSAGGGWADTGNWDNGVPDEHTAAIFNLGASSAYEVSFAEAAIAGEMRVRTGTIDLNLGGQTLTVDTVLFLGYDVGDNAHLRPDNGSLTSVWADIGHHAATGGAPGRMTLTGPDATWNNSMDITVARGTTGTLDILDGANVTIGRYAFVGNSASGEPDAADGTLNVDGSGSEFVAQRLSIGFAGNGGSHTVAGTVHVTDHAVLTCSTGQIAVGANGTGSLTVSGGSTVTSAMGTSPSSSSGIIGSATVGYYGVGVVTLRDPGTSWTQDGALSAGFTGQGTLTVDHGATAHSRWGHVAHRAGSLGQAAISGSGSDWTIDAELYVGGEASPARGGLGQGGTGTLDVRDGATVTVGQRLEIWDEGAVDVTGGGRVLVGPGIIPAPQNRLYVAGGGRLAGSGVVRGTTVNLGGVIAPGHSIGVLNLDELDHQAGVLELEIDGLMVGSGYDQLIVETVLTIAPSATLVIAVNENGGTYTDPAVPGQHDDFSVIVSGQRTGTFGSIYYDGELLAAIPASGDVFRCYVGDGLFRIAEYADTGVAFSNYRALPGDANGDMLVDGSDFGIWNCAQVHRGHRLDDRRLQWRRSHRRLGLWHLERAQVHERATGGQFDPGTRSRAAAGRVLAAGDKANHMKFVTVVPTNQTRNRFDRRYQYLGTVSGPVDNREATTHDVTGQNGKWLLVGQIDYRPNAPSRQRRESRTSIALPIQTSSGTIWCMQSAREWSLGWRRRRPNSSQGMRNHQEGQPRPVAADQCAEHNRTSR